MNILYKEYPMSEALQAFLDSCEKIDPHDEKRFPSGGHVSILFADGEVCSTKAGSLFGQRNCHCHKKATRTKPYTDVQWPGEMHGHPCLFYDIEGYKEEEAFLEKALELIPKEDRMDEEGEFTPLLIFVHYTGEGCDQEQHVHAKYLPLCMTPRQAIEMVKVALQGTSLENIETGEEMMIAVEQDEKFLERMGYGIQSFKSNLHQLYGFFKNSKGEGTVNVLIVEGKDKTKHWAKDPGRFRRWIF